MIRVFVKRQTNVCGELFMDSKPSRPIYLDYAATTPVDPEVAELVVHYMVEEFGNAGSRTHEYGVAAAKAVSKARKQVADVVDARADDVIFTSGATEANNLAILGLTAFGIAKSRRHIIGTQIEHKSVLEPLEEMERRGFEVTLLPPNRGGWVEPEKVEAALRDDTLLVSVMHVNNETGVIQSIAEIGDFLEGHAAYFHTDAAQGFAKDLEPLRHARVDLISMSGHKIYAPKGVGALIMKRRDYRRAPIEPLMFGGGQERGVRPGTLAVPLIAGIGLASHLVSRDAAKFWRTCELLRSRLMDAIDDPSVTVNGDQRTVLPSILNLSVRGWDSEALVLAMKEQVAIATGAACTVAEYKQSHVLHAMGRNEDADVSSLRVSWSTKSRVDALGLALSQICSRESSC
jgi:cysteine desulfurase